MQTSTALKLGIGSEWGELQSAIFHNGENSIDLTFEDQKSVVEPDRLARHPECGACMREEIMRQHAVFRRILENAGVELVTPETQKAFCQLFTRDPQWVVGEELFVAGKMRDDYRDPELLGLEEIKKRVGRVIPVSEGVVEGGDVMVINPGLVMIGSGEISDAAGVSFMARHLKEKGIEVVHVPHDGLHLDCVLAPLPNGKALISAVRLPAPSLAVLAKYFPELTPLDPEEDMLSLASNLFWLNPEEVVSTAHSPKTNELLRGEMGYRVHAPQYDQMHHMWGGTRCTVGPLRRAAL